MEKDDKIKRARNNAYLLLHVRPRSEAELRRRLEQKDYDTAVVEDVIAHLKKTGNIDDRRFAKFWIESRMHANPVGDVILKHELKEKGLSDAVIEEAIDSKEESYDEYKIALDMAKERFERFKQLDRRKATKRVYDFLLRRGFKYDTIRKIIDDISKQALD